MKSRSLTAEQILRTWRLDAELVTLSACETGLGQRQGGEGYLGFAQALFLSGSRSLVLSAWQVDDRATSLSMTRFYQNLLGQREGLVKPLAKGAALSEAKRWLRGLTSAEAESLLANLPGEQAGQSPATETTSAPSRSAAERSAAESHARPNIVRLNPGGAMLHPFAHPYYWSGFVLIGDAGEVAHATPVLEPEAQPPSPAWRRWLVGGSIGVALVGLLTIILRRLRTRCPRDSVDT